jgi:serine phosphatase RsbU (regulator of sigma subunit)
VVGYDIDHRFGPADFVGGDFFDYVRLDDERVVMVIGDVAGRGISAALIMARLNGAIRSHLVAQPTLPLALAAINRAAVKACGDRFVTLLLLAASC